MAAHGRPRLHRIYDAVSGAKWRPTHFVDEATLNRYACCVCDVIPSTTVVLPCSHTLCEPCLVGCRVEDGGSCCPLDRKRFTEAMCKKTQLPAQKKQNLKAYCWNEPNGCRFMGPLADLLIHYETVCKFHSFPCQRCGKHFPNAQLSAHYIGGCGDSRFATRGAGGATISRCSGDIEVATATRGADDDVAALQGQVNELKEASRMQDAQLRVLNTALAATLDTMTTKIALAAEKFSQTIGEASEQLHGRLLAGRTPESSHAPDGENAAGASCLDDEKLWREETWYYLRNLGSIDYTLQGILSNQSLPPPIRGELSLTPGESSSATPNETVYHMVLSHPHAISECEYTVTALTHFHDQGQWFAAAAKIRRYDSLDIDFSWCGKLRHGDHFPEVVRVAVLHGGEPVDLKREDLVRGRTQNYGLRTPWSVLMTGHYLLFEIAIK